MTRTTRWLSRAVVLCSLPYARAALPTPPPIELSPPRATAAVVGANPVYVGQMTQVEVALWRDARADNQIAPFFPELRAHGAIALLAVTAPPPEQREDRGAPFLVQKRRYLLFPQRPGSIRVPSIRVELRGPWSSVGVQAPSVELSAAAVPTAGAPPLVARQVRLEREIEGNLDGLRVGDALTVSLRLTARDTHALVLPAQPAPELRGMVRYPGEPRTSTRAVRGAYSAERVDTATYVARDWGRHTLPEQSVSWLDPETGELHRATAPALPFRARMNPQLGLGCFGSPAATARAGGELGALVSLACFGVWLARRLAARRARYARVARSSDERAAFAAVLQAAHSGQDGATLTALYRWLRFSLSGVPTLEGLRHVDADRELAFSTEALEGRLCARATKGCTGEVVEPLKGYRRSRRPARAPASRLPELNSRAWRTDSRERSGTPNVSAMKPTEE